MRISTLSLFVAIAMIGIGPGIGKADDAQDAEIEAMRKALSKYEDSYVAVRELYLSTVGCVYYDGTKKEGYMDYTEGGYGHSLRQRHHSGAARSDEAQRVGI